VTWYSFKMIMAPSALSWCFTARRSLQAMAVSLVKGCNAAVGHQASALRVGFSAPMDCVAPLGKGMALAGEPRLAMNAEKPTEGVIISLKEY
jgi:hypothetical protein